MVHWYTNSNHLLPHTNNIKIQFFCNLQQMRHLFRMTTKLHAQWNKALVIHRW